MSSLISASDLQGVTDLDAAQLGQLARDIDAVLIGELPCLETLDEQKKARARSIVRLALSNFDRAGVTSISRTRGPFSERISYGDAAGVSDLVDSLIPKLAALCSEARVYEHGMYSVPLGIPPVWT